MKTRVICYGTLIVLALTSAFSQELQIASPAPNTSVTVGQSLDILVSAQGTAFSQVGIVATDPIADLGPLTTPPYQFTLNVPNTLPPGHYQLTALGIDSAGNVSLSPSIVISIEPAVSVVALTVQPSKLTFQFVGQRLPLIVSGHLADGTVVDLTHSNATTYLSKAPLAVTIDNAGFATAVGATSTGASIVVTRGTLSVNVPVTIPASIRGDLNGDSVVDKDDLNILMRALNTPAMKPVDARDLNGDGVINALDARILVTLCTRSGCATH